MIVNNIIERAEKYRLLGRFDKTSAISFLNDGLYEIAKRQSIKREEQVFGYVAGLPIRVNNKVIKVESVEIKDDDKDPKNFSIRVMQDGSMELFKKDSEGNFKKPTFDDDLSIDEMVVVYTGCPEINNINTTFDFPSELETALMYFVRSRMLEEIGELEQSQYFEGKYINEVRMKAAPKVDVISQPSEYSLR